MEELRVADTLSAFTTALKVLKEDKQFAGPAYYYLLSLDFKAKELSIEGYTKREFNKAMSDSLDREKVGDANAVVVVDSLKALERAYPNCYLHTRRFMQNLDKFIAS